MTSFSEQLSAVRKSQWEAQLDVLRALSNRALDNTEQLIALNMKTSRASMEQAAGAFKQMLDARDPRDLFAMGAAAQGQWQQLFSYSRALLGIATGAQVRSWSSLPAAAPLQLIAAPAADALAPLSQVMEQAAIASAEATTVASEIAAAATDANGALAEATLDAVDPAKPQAQPDAAPAAAVPEVSELEAEKTGADPVETPREDDAAQAPTAAKEAAAPTDIEAAIETAIADDVPPAKAKPLARALSEVAPKPAAVEHPLASTLPLEAKGHIELPVLTPAEHAAPLQAPAREARSSRASRKK